MPPDGHHLADGLHRHLHVHFCIEHMLLAHSKDVVGIAHARESSRTGSPSTRPNRSTPVSTGRTRSGFPWLPPCATSTYETATKLSPVFRERFGKLILLVFDQFKPFVVHSQAALQVLTALGNTHPQVQSILFEGQNMGRTFNEYRSHMKEKEKAARQTKTPLPPEVQNTIAKLDGTHKMLEEQRQSLLRAHNSISVTSTRKEN